MLSQIMQIIGLLLNIIGAIFFAVPVLKSKKAIEEESGTYWNYNPPLRKAMKRERTLGIIGLVFLLLGFVLQIIAMFL